MKHQTLKTLLSRAALVLFVLSIPALALAQGSPWESAAQILEQAFTGIIARAFSLIAIVAGGLTLAYGEGSGNRRMAGVIFGVGMAVGAVNFLSWLFGA
jgi:type IV secretory pathway VirB2 component (pilin)